MVTKNVTVNKEEQVTERTEYDYVCYHTVLARINVQPI